ARGVLPGARRSCRRRDRAEPVGARCASHAPGGTAREVVLRRVGARLSPAPRLSSGPGLRGRDRDHRVPAARRHPRGWVAAASRSLPGHDHAIRTLPTGPHDLPPDWPPHAPGPVAERPKGGDTRWRLVTSCSARSPTVWTRLSAFSLASWTRTRRSSSAREPTRSRRSPVRGLQLAGASPNRERVAAHRLSLRSHTAAEME